MPIGERDAFDRVVCLLGPVPRPHPGIIRGHMRIVHHLSRSDS